MSPQTMRIVLISLAFLTGLVSVFAVILILSGRTPAPVVATASAIGGPFALTDHRGQPITDADLRGKPFLVFFGFFDTGSSAQVTGHSVALVGLCAVECRFPRVCSNICRSACFHQRLDQ